MPIQIHAQSAKMKVALYIVETCGWMDLSNPSAPWMQTKINCLDYIKSLGYTHVLYQMIGPLSAFFKKDAGGKWQYNSGNYATGEVASSFKDMKKAIEDRGMKMIPLVTSLSHCDAYITLDPTISEFNAATTCANYKVGGTLVCNLDHVAYVGCYPYVKNDPMDQLFEEYMKIINANWGSTAIGGSYPEYIHIGHDELAVSGCYCMIKAVRSSILAQTASELVAREIAYRYKEIQDNLTIRSGATIKIMIFGDSFLPSENGEIYGLCGNVNNGNDGVLKILRDNTSIANLIAAGVASNTIVMPWDYSGLDGSSREPSPCDGTKIDKVAQAKFLDNLGYKWIPASGEDGDGTTNLVNNPTYPLSWKNTAFEWVRAAQLYPSLVQGYACLHYDPFDTHGSATGYYIGTVDPALMYLINYPYIASTNSPDLKCNYYPGVFAGVNAIMTRNDRQFTSGIHYTTGMGLEQIGTVKSTDAQWNNGFTEYTLTGNVNGDIWGNADNLTYAFTQQNCDFEVIAQIKSRTNVAKAGIMVRQKMTTGSPHVYLHYNSKYNTLALHHRSQENGTTIQDATVTQAGSTYLKVKRLGNIIYTFYGYDGTNWTSLGQVSLNNGPVFVGLANSATTGSGNVTYANVSIKVFQTLRQ